MAQMFSPVCTDALKINHNPSWRLFSKPTTISVSKRRRLGRVKVATADAVADDYYSVLGLLPDATPAQIKKAYYNCMKACHPDLSGDDPETTNFCMFINEVYEVLSDPVQRMIYDEINGYALTAINPFLDDSKAKDHVFVDEFSCIGCKNCANVAGDVFSIEEDFGRARAYCQSGARDLVQQAIESCPVDCIHWTSAAQLSLLEDEMRRVERVNVAFMLAGMGAAAVDVFRVASSRWEKRQAKVLALAKMRMTKQKDPSNAESYWDNLWGKPKEHQSSDSKPTLIWSFLQKRKWKRGRSGRLLLHEDGGSTPGVVLISLPLISYRRPCPTWISHHLLIYGKLYILKFDHQLENEAANTSSLYR